MTAYFSDDLVKLYHGDCRELLPGMGGGAVLIADPPYAETNLEWDTWPEGWPSVLSGCAPQLWCFGSMRMFLDRRDEFADWQFAQEIVWEKHNGSGFRVDRFRRIHELVTHWYHGPWADLTRETPTTPDATARVVRKKAKPSHWHGATGEAVYVSEDGGPRLQRSVIKVRSEHARAVHPTQKPLGILDPLIAYSSNPGDVILDPFSGAGSVLLAARQAGRRAIGCEADERYCEIAATRLSNGEMFGVLA